MGLVTKIQWTDSTFNPWRGCAKVSEGCRHCYAAAMSVRNPSVLGVWGRDGTRVVASESKWREPLIWDRAAKAKGVRHRVFCASLADVFEDWSGPMVDAGGNPVRRAGQDHHALTMTDMRYRLFDLIDLTPNLDWLLVTKRPENVPDMWCGGYRDNVWLLTSVEDQETAENRIPSLTACRDLASVLGLSMEPLLGPVDLGRWLSVSSFDWVIVGGESGPGARSCDTSWIRAIRDQCEKAGVACFVKQLGSRPVEAGRRMGLRDSKGGDPGEWPEDLRDCRQFPRVG
jgi:protein gp37